jgi:hypothetical protein
VGQFSSAGDVTKITYFQFTHDSSTGNGDVNFKRHVASNTMLSQRLYDISAFCPNSDELFNVVLPSHYSRPNTFNMNFLSDLLPTKSCKIISLSFPLSVCLKLRNGFLLRFILKRFANPCLSFYACLKWKLLWTEVMLYSGTHISFWAQSHVKSFHSLDNKHNTRIANTLVLLCSPCIS